MNEMQLVAADLLKESQGARSGAPSRVSQRLAAMSSLERERLHYHLSGQLGLMRGIESRSDKQDEQLAAYEALDREVLGAERDHVRNLVNSGAATIEPGTQVVESDGYSLGGGGSYPEPARIPGVTQTLAGSPMGMRDQARRTIDRAHDAGELPDHAAEKATRLVKSGPAHDQSLASRWAIAAGDDAYKSAFAKLLGDPERGHLLWDDREKDAYRRVAHLQSEMRAMSLTDASGGYMVPLTLDPAILLSSDGSNNPLRRISRVVQTVTDQWSGVTSAGVTAEWKAEAAETADASPALTQPNIPVHFGDAFVPYSFEVGMDAVNFLEELQRVLVDGADQLMATAYTTGTGSGQPTGIVTALAGTSSEINSSGTEALVAADAYTIQNALPPRFQANAQWCMNIAIINTFAQFQTTNGSLMFPEIREGRLLNKPLNELSNMDGSINAAVTANNYLVLYGDFQNFVIVDRIGTTLELIPNLVGASRRPTGQRGALLWFRTGSDSVVDQAFRLLDVPTTA